MTIWTIYNHGTGGSSLKTADKAEIVNLFGNNDRRREFEGKLTTEGVGSIGDPHKIALEFGRDAAGNYDVTRTHGGASNFATRGIRSGTGGGVQENVDSVVELVRALNLAGAKPSAINMLGWSRGAVTCTRIAYALYQSQDHILRSIPIRIFAVDPVAGAGHNDEVDATTVTPNVEYYLATLATGEKRRFFKPIAGELLKISDPNATRAWVLPVPGHHSDTAKMNNNVGKLVFNLAYRFLSGCGTPVPAMRHYMLDDLAAWKLYEELVVGAAKVHKTSFFSKLVMGVKGYDRSDEKAAHDFGESFFPNVHARKVFEGAYPMCHFAYFDPGNVNRRNTIPWGAQYSPAIVMEQKRNGMSQAMIHKLEALKPGADAAPMVPPHVDLMAMQLGLVD